VPRPVSTCSTRPVPRRGCAQAPSQSQSAAHRAVASLATGASRHSLPGSAPTRHRRPAASHRFLQALCPKGPTPAPHCHRTRSISPSCSRAGCCASGEQTLVRGAPARLNLASSKVNRNWSFFDLRDSLGTVQLVASSKSQDGRDPVLADLGQVPGESPVMVRGTVRRRPDKQIKPASPGMHPSPQTNHRGGRKNRWVTLRCW
jgi:hypothetical protein